MVGEALLVAECNRCLKDISAQGCCDDENAGTCDVVESFT